MHAFTVKDLPLLYPPIPNLDSLNQCYAGEGSYLQHEHLCLCIQWFHCELSLGLACILFVNNGKPIQNQQDRPGSLCPSGNPAADFLP